MEIKDSVVLITGASSGIGLATARLFAREGARLALAARSVDLLEQLAAELHAEGAEVLIIPVDLTVQGQAAHAVKETVKCYGRIDILINNAGQAAIGSIADVEIENLRQIMALNLYAPLEAMQAAIPVMRTRKSGSIINISSMVSKMRLPNLGAYAATKSALNMLTDTARVELAGDGIRLITVYPRMTSTDFAKHSLGNTGYHRQVHANPNIQSDTPEYVATKILSAAMNEPDEQFMTE
ncbi:MAG: SDR family oxidoreductase [bacterium]